MVDETLTAFKRAGADIILTYHALDWARRARLKGGKACPALALLYTIRVCLRSFAADKKNGIETLCSIRPSRDATK